MQEFRELLSKRRIEKGLTLRKLGELVGLSPSYLSEMEHGIKPPPKQEEKIDKLAQILEIPSVELFKLAQIERATGNIANVISNLINQDKNLALGLCRVAEDEARRQEFNEKLKKLISEMEDKSKEDE